MPPVTMVIATPCLPSCRASSVALAATVLMHLAPPWQPAMASGCRDDYAAPRYTQPRQQTYCTPRTVRPTAPRPQVPARPVYRDWRPAPRPVHRETRPEPAPPPPVRPLCDTVPIWSGLYAGGHLGLGLSTVSFETATGGTSEQTRSVLSGGAHVGRNWRFGSFVAGLEADLSRQGIGGARGVPSFGPSYSAESGVPWLATGRARFGFVVDRALIYATGGLAVGRLDTRITGPGQSIAIEDWRIGTVWGGGIEMMLGRSVSGRIEALRSDFGEDRVTAGGLAARIGSRETTVRAGLTFHLD